MMIEQVIGGGLRLRAESTHLPIHHGVLPQLAVARDLSARRHLNPPHGPSNDASGRSLCFVALAQLQC